jgi:glycosyltransferase involved in cell wall biosynthesis
VLVGVNAQKLFVTQDYRNAGVSRYIERLTRHLPLVAGPERYVLYTNEHVRRWEGVEGERLRIVSTPVATTRPVARILWEQLVLPVLAMRDGVDLLHCPLNVRPVLGRAPVVLTIHDLTFVRFPERFSPFKQRYLASFTRLSAQRARRIVTDSAATKRDVEQAFGVAPALVDVVYPGVDGDFRPFDPDLEADATALRCFRERHHLPARFILYLGTLEPRKNVDRLIGAFAALVRRGLPHHLVLAGGKGWHYDAIYRAIDVSGVKERIVVPGYVAREEQPLWYNAAELFVYPSQYEGFGLPPLEAMACGVPVVTSNTSSLPEVVGGAGITVDPTDNEALTEAMISVLTDESRAAALRAAGRQRASGFTWPAAAEACVASYRKALQEAAPA